MYIPDYSITNYTLKNLASAEFSKGEINTTTILKNWEARLIKDAKVKTILNMLLRQGFSVEQKQIKALVEGISKKAPDVVIDAVKTYDYILETMILGPLTEKELKNIMNMLTKNKTYRAVKTTTQEQKLNPEEILATITQLINWFNSLDAKDTHPVIALSILKANLEYIYPLNKYNVIFSDLIDIYCLKTSGYLVNGYLSINEHYVLNYRYFNKYINDCVKNDDFTQWIEFFTESYNKNITALSDQIKIIAKDTKIAKAAGKAQLNERQEKIVTYLQDYGRIQNKQFSLLFPKLSEDTVLRELKDLANKGIVIKKGKTKSSRYELV